MAKKKTTSKEGAPTGAPPALPSEIIRTPLYALANEYTALLDELCELAEENDGLLPDDFDAKFDEIQADVTEKLDNTCVVIRGVAQHQAMLKAEEDRLRDRRKTLERAEAWVKEYMVRQMVRMGIERSDGPRFKVRTQLSNPSCLVNDEDRVPDEYCDVTVTMPAVDFGKLMKLATEHGLDLAPVKGEERTVRRSEVVDEWKAAAGAENVPGTTVVQRRHLRIW